MKEFLNKKILCDKDSWNQAIKEESEEWVQKILKFLNLDFGIIYGDNKNKSVKYLIEQGIHIEVSKNNTRINIFKLNKEIGEWHVEKISVKKDEDNLLYSEILINYWSVIDKQKKQKRIKK